MTRLLVLGAGRHQVPLIARANTQGIETVVVDPFEESPGKLIASHAVLGDALDEDVIGAAARRYEVDGLATVGTDQAVLPWAKVAAELGLPCHVSPEAAVAATNKRVMRRVLIEHDVPMTPAVTLEDGDGLSAVDGLRFPLVVKAADSQGQRGMTVVEDAKFLGSSVVMARAASRSATVVLEEYRRGPEVTINAWLEDGRLVLCSVHDRLTYNPPPHVGICLQHIAPSIHAHDDQFALIAQRVAEAYGMTRGPLYIQVIVAEDEVFVVEAAARVGGGHEAQLLPRLMDVDLIDWTIDLALGRPTSPWSPTDPLSPPVACAGLVCFVVARPGEVDRLSSFEEFVRAGWVDEGAWYVDAGHRQPPVVDSMGRIGYFIVTGPDVEGAVARAQDVYSRLNVMTRDGKGLVYWPDDEFLNLRRSR